MIGVFDSGHGGLTVLRALLRQFPNEQFVYLGDHANAPYGERQSDEILDLTRKSVEHLFSMGCRLVILACNTATAVACRHLQQEWLPKSGFDGHNILGIIAPVVEIATQTPWTVTTPQYPQELNEDLIAVLATTRTVSTNVYVEEILKRCPKTRIIQQSCPNLAGKIEEGASPAELEQLVHEYVDELMEKCDGHTPHHAILGCTHFPLVETYFQEKLPPSTRLLNQPTIVASSLTYYLARHPEYSNEIADGRKHTLLTTGESFTVNEAIGPIFGGAWEAERFVFETLDR